MTKVLLAGLGAAALVALGTAGTALGATHVVLPGQSIQAAVDAAAPGDTVVVEAGVYREEVVVRTDGLTLVGRSATLEPPTTASGVCADPELPGSTVGICLLGEIDFETFEVLDYVEDVTVTGFTVRGFSDAGFFAFGARGAAFDRKPGRGQRGVRLLRAALDRHPLRAQRRQGK